MPPSASTSCGHARKRPLSDREESMQRIFKATHREHEIKLRMLQIELERAELQKQTAVNELKTSEIKKQLMEDQAAEYYRWSRIR